jgi:hypothetical protein
MMTSTAQPLRIFSDGIGLNSVTALVLQAQGLIHYDAFVFANVGEDSESEKSLRYRREIVEPFAEEHNITLVERWRLIRGERVTLKEATLADNRSIPIPIVFPGKGFGNRTCTEMWKAEVVNRYITREAKTSQCVIGIGYTIDEGARVFKKIPGWHEHNWSRETGGTWKQGKKLGYSRLYEFPLIDQRLNRSGCEQMIEAAGLPPVPPSRCKWCPFISRTEWIDEKRNDDPEYFEAIDFQNAVNEKYQRIRGTHPKASPFVAIHRDGIRLEDVPDQAGLWDRYMDTDESNCQSSIASCGL